MSDLITDIWNSQAGAYGYLSLKYRDGRWADHAFKRHVHQFKGIADWIDAHRSENVYWCPHLFSAAHRREEYAMPSQYAWVDNDEVDPRRLRPRPTIAIQTSPGRFQTLYWFDKPLLKQLRKGLNDHVGGDSGGWMLTKVLRVPGTKNFKYDPPARVKLLWCDGPRHYRNDWVKYEVEDVVDEVMGDVGERPVGDADAILKKYRVDRSLLITCVPPRDGRPGQRSDVIWKIAISLVEARASREEVGAAVYGSASFRSKWGRNLKRLWAEVDAAFAKAKR
jgi:hypothetical protein